MALVEQILRCRDAEAVMPYADSANAMLKSRFGVNAYGMHVGTSSCAQVGDDLSAEPTHGRSCCAHYDKRPCESRGVCRNATSRRAVH